MPLCSPSISQRRGSHIKSDYTRTIIIQHTLISLYTKHLRLDYSSCPLFCFPKPHHVTASHPPPGEKPPERGRAVRKNT